jgi:hypothetical protein
MTVLTQPLDSQAWYKYPWPWFLMAIPALTIVAGILTLMLAGSSFDGLVKDDYYKQGLAVNQALARDQQATALGLTAQVMMGDKEARVFLTMRSDVDIPEKLYLRFMHPTQGGRDGTVELVHMGQGFYSGAMAPLGTSKKWNVILSSDSGEAQGDMVEKEEGSWRLSGVWTPAEQSGTMALMPSANL